ncbi:MAG TPA: hypothetical protein VGC80_06580, partial [Acetobacteraceae bacterium]
PASTRRPDQKQDYGEGYPVRLLWILGTEVPREGTTWQRIRGLAVGVRPTVSIREAVTLDMLVGAIDDILGLMPPARMRRLALPHDLPDDPWFLEACRPLIDLHTTGMVGAHAHAKGSASIRLRGPGWAITAKSRHVGMAMVQAMQPGKVFFPSPGHLRRHLSPKLHPWVAEWQGALEELTPAWAMDRRQWVSVQVTGSDQKAAAVAKSFEALVGRLCAG